MLAWRHLSAHYWAKSLPCSHEIFAKFVGLTRKWVKFHGKLYSFVIVNNLINGSLTKPLNFVIVNDALTNPYFFSCYIFTKIFNYLLYFLNCIICGLYIKFYNLTLIFVIFLPNLFLLYPYFCHLVN